MGIEATEGLHFLASLPLAGTGRTEGGEKTQHFKRFHSRLFSFFIGDFPVLLDDMCSPHGRLACHLVVFCHGQVAEWADLDGAKVALVEGGCRHPG